MINVISNFSIPKASSQNPSFVFKATFTTEITSPVFKTSYHQIRNLVWLEFSPISLRSPSELYPASRFTLNHWCLRAIEVLILKALSFCNSFSTRSLAWFECPFAITSSKFGSWLIIYSSKSLSVCDFVFLSLTLYFSEISPSLKLDLLLLSPGSNTLRLDLRE